MEDPTPIAKYKRHFFSEFRKCIKELSLDEQIHFTNTLVEMSVYAYQDQTDPHIFELQDRELLAKYRHRMKYYVLSGFVNFLFDEPVHFEKACTKAEINPADLRDDLENGNVFMELTGMMENIKTLLYISEPKAKGAESDKMELETDKLLERSTPAVGRKNGITTARQVLTLYYLFKAMGIKMRGDVNVSVMAKFLHLLLGWDYADINNSQIYKLLKLAPKVKEDKKSLKEDFNWVKKQFENINFELPAKMIEEELKTLL
ncbi:MAG: hypothetical protein ACXVO9_00950 [Bacteroidia bacterium]